MCADIYQEHAYLVRLTKGRDAKVQVFEVFGRPPTEREPQWAPETILRCEASRDVWDVISPEARAEFNRRLKAEGKPAGRWGADETAVQRLFGKELLVLLWAVELAGREAGGDRGRDPQLARAEARGALVALHHDGGGDRPRASARDGLARRAAAGAVLRHAGGHIPSRRGRWARNAGAEGQRGLSLTAQAQVAPRQTKKPDDPGFLFAAPLPAE